ncbi:myoneurin-like [Branchiostoma floridae]|uniref:Myoneurin-like n=1 Tax=Branchiostoma floridae TaxID=7739 RepID=A0A9J7MAM6_BRAFL|nr:myoneurin-like [Branchiostoma floridae]
MLVCELSAGQDAGVRAVSEVTLAMLPRLYVEELVLNKVSQFHCCFRLATMLVCGLSREVTLAVLPRLYVEELVLELGRRNIHPLTDSSSREDLISLLCDVMIEEYSRGRKAACTNRVQQQQHSTTTALQRKHSTPTATRQASGHESRNTTPSPATSTKTTTSMERQRRPSGQTNGSLGKQVSSSVPVRETQRTEYIGDVIVVEDDEPELGHGMQEAQSTEVPSMSVRTRQHSKLQPSPVLTHQHSRPQPSPVQRGRHTSSNSTEPPACNTPDACSSTGIQRVLSPEENNVRPYNQLQRTSGKEASPKEPASRDANATIPEIQEVEQRSNSQPDSSLNVGSTTTQGGGPGTESLTNVEMNNHTETTVQETSVLEAAVPEVIMNISNNLTEDSSQNNGHNNTTGAVRTVDSLAVYSQEFFNSGSARPPGFLQTMPSISPSQSEPVFQTSNAEGSISCPVLLEALGMEGSSSNDSLLGAQQPTCTVTTSEEAMAIWQDLSKRSQTTESDGSTTQSKRGKKRKAYESSRHVCQECGYKAPSNCALVIHMRKHTGEKPYGCDLCGYRTAYKTSMVAHTMKHKGDKPYMCGECGYRCVQKGHLTEHMKIHINAGEKYFHCGYNCGYKTTEEHYLEIHTCKNKPSQDTETTVQE